MKMLRLRDAVYYSKERVSVDSLSLDTYLTTDNLLQNKKGKEKASSLPPSGKTFPSYDYDSILIGNIRPYLKKIWLANDSGAHSADVLNLITKAGFDPKFVYYNCLQDAFFDHMMSGSKGSKMPRGDKNQILEFPIPNFSKTKQKSIGRFLFNLDQKIELNNQINAELEAMAKLVYDYWFVQFDFPDKNGKPYKASGGKMIYNEELKREIPEGWDDGIFEDIAQIIGGSTPSKADPANFTDGNGTPWITPRDLSNNKGKKYITRGEFDVTEQGIKKASLKLMPAGTILLSSRAPIGYMAIARETVTTNQGFKSFVPKSYFTTEFLYYQIKNKIPLIEARSSGSTFKEVSASTLKTVSIILPPVEIIEEYQNIAKPIFEKQNVLEQQNQELASLRDWLLPMLMNGQVTVGKLNSKLKKKVTSYGEMGDELRRVAEDEAEYSDSLFGEEGLVLNYDYELVTVVLLTEKHLGLNYGRKYFHKMFSNMQFLASLPKINKLNFIEHGWGMFSKSLAKSIDKEVYIHTSKLDNGHKVYKVKSTCYKEVTSWINNSQNKPFVDEVNEMLSIYKQPLIDCSMDRIELLNTVLECIKVLGTYEFPKIYAKMKTWKMNDGLHKFKSDKFRPEETMHMVALVRGTKMELED